MLCLCDDTRPEFLNTRTPVARKEHKCDECQRCIPVGTRYVYRSGKTEEEFWQSRLCVQCDNDWNEIEDVFYQNGDEPCHCIGDIAENVAEAHEMGWIEDDDDLVLRHLPQKKPLVDDRQLELPM